MAQLLSLTAAEARATEELEIRLLLEALFQRFGYDFRADDLATASSLQDRVLRALAVPKVWLEWTAKSLWATRRRRVTSGSGSLTPPVSA